MKNVFDLNVSNGITYIFISQRVCLHEEVLIFLYFS